MSDRHEVVQWDGRAVIGGAPRWIAEAVRRDPLTPNAIMRIGHTVHVFDAAGKLASIAEPGDWLVHNMITGEILKQSTSEMRTLWELRGGGFYRCPPRMSNEEG